MAAARAGLLLDTQTGGSQPMPERQYRLSEAIGLLRRINGLVSRKGTPIWDWYSMEGHSLWAFWQTYLFETCLKVYTRNREILARLEDAGPGASRGAGPLPPDLRFLMDRQAGETRAGRWKAALFLSAVRPALSLAWPAAVRLGGKRVAIYTPDLISDADNQCDFRFSRIVTHLEQERVDYAEIFHTCDLSRSLRNAFKRGKVPYYTDLWRDPGMPRRHEEADLAGIRDLGLPMAHVLERHVAYFLDCCRLSAAKVAAMRKAIRRSGVQALIGMDDFRANQELLLACRLEGVPTVLIQHGLITPYHVGWFQYGIPVGSLVQPDKFLVRSPFWLEVLREGGSHLAARAEAVSGLEDNGASRTPAAVPAEGRDRLDVLLLLETLWDPEEARPFVAKLLEDSRLRVHFKIRPDMSEEAQVRPYFGNARPHAIIREWGDASSRMDVILGSHSSLMYKLLEWKKPVFRMITSFEFGEQLSRHGLVDDLPADADFHGRFSEALAADPAIYRKRLERFQGKEDLPHYREALAPYLEDRR